MKKKINFLNWKTLITILVTTIASISIRYLFLKYQIDILDVYNNTGCSFLSFFTINSIRFAVRALLEEDLLEKYFMATPSSSISMSIRPSGSSYPLGGAANPPGDGAANPPGGAPYDPNRGFNPNSLTFGQEALDNSRFVKGEPMDIPVPSPQIKMALHHSLVNWRQFAILSGSNPDLGHVLDEGIKIYGEEHMFGVSKELRKIIWTENDLRKYVTPSGGIQWSRISTAPSSKLMKILRGV